MVARVETEEEAAAPGGAVSIVLADDHEVVRNGLRMLLDAEDGFEVVAEAGDLEATRRYVRAHRPQVLVLDVNMPEGSSLPRSPSSGAVSRHRDRGPDDAEGPGVRARGDARRRARLRAQAVRRHRAGRRGARRGGRRDLPEPQARRPGSGGPARAGGPSRRPDRARARDPAPDRARPHQLRDRRASST